MSARKSLRERLPVWRAAFTCGTLVFAGIGACTCAAAEPADGEEARLLEIPDPRSGENPVFPPDKLDEPPVGQPYKDPHFGTRIVRATHRGKIRHEYARFDPFNCDKSMVLLHDIQEGNFAAYRTDSMPWDAAANRIRTIELEEIRWDPRDAQCVWGQREFRIVRLNVVTGKDEILKDFAADPTISPLLKANPDLYRITMKGEGESSVDLRHWAFGLQGQKEDYRLRFLFTWDRERDRVEGVRAVAPEESKIDWVGMSPLGHCVLIGGDHDNGGSLTGLVMANRELTRFHRIDYATGHSDVGLDSEGREVIVMQNIRTDCIDLIPLDWNTKPILETGGSYEGTHRIPLVKLFYSDQGPTLSSGVHISCNAAGSAVVSTYLEPGAAGKNWLDRSLVLILLDRKAPRAFYLARLHNRTKSYWEETQATISRDGSKVIWAENWEQAVGEERVSVMKLDLPKGWRPK